MSQNLKTFLKLLAGTVFIVVSATFLIRTYEHVSAAEALYRSLYIGLTHHDNFHMETPEGKIVVLLLVVASLIVIAYLLKMLADYMMNLGDGLKRNKMKAKLVNMKDHYIVCGLGRVGMNIAKELANENVKFVGIDKDENLVKDAVARGFTAFVGDSTKEEMLKRAKVETARGVVAALGDDSSNLFVTLTARQLNASLYIVARSNHSENVSRIQKAGADKVAMPNQIGGFHMATMVIRPGVLDFFDVLTSKDSANLQVEELIVTKGSKLVGAKLGPIMQAIGEGVAILALNNSEGKSKVNPTGQETVYEGDKLILMGTKKQLDTLSRNI